jgi:hypothetical protein
MIFSERSLSQSRTQSGAVLFVGMMLLILLTLLAVTSSRGSGMQERMAGNMRQLSVAFESAEGSHLASRRDALEYARQESMALASISEARQVELKILELQTSADTAELLDEATYADDSGGAIVESDPGDAGVRSPAIRVMVRYDRVSSLSSIEAGLATQDSLLFYKLTGVAVSGADDRAAPVITSEIFVP